MIIDEFAEVKWGSVNKKFYADKGYTYTKRGDTVLVKVCDLMDSCKVKVRVRCSECGTVKLVRLDGYKVNLNKCLINRYICKHCIGIYHRLSSEQVYAAFVTRGYSPEFTTYKSQSDKLPYRCNLHPEVIQYITYNGLVAPKGGCKLCASESMSKSRKGKTGVKSTNWKGGISPITAILRHEIYPWVQNILHNHKFTCDITKVTRDLQVHHLNVSFSKIVKEVFTETTIEVKPTIQDYSELEIKTLSTLILKKHFECVTGVCITKPVHKLLHKIYGNMTCSEEDYYEFKSRYLSGEFNEEKA